MPEYGLVLLNPGSISLYFTGYENGVPIWSPHLDSMALFSSVEEVKKIKASDSSFTECRIVGIGF